MLRDIQNKITREDIEILDRYQAFKAEKILKVLKYEDQKEESGVIRLYVFTDSSFVYVYQLFTSGGYSQSKLNLQVE